MGWAKQPLIRSVTSPAGAVSSQRWQTLWRSLQRTKNHGQRPTGARLVGVAVGVVNNTRSPGCGDAASVSFGGHSTLRVEHLKNRRVPVPSRGSKPTPLKRGASKGIAVSHKDLRPLEAEAFLVAAFLHGLRLNEENFRSVHCSRNSLTCFEIIHRYLGEDNRRTWFTFDNLNGNRVRNQKRICTKTPA